ANDPHRNDRSLSVDPQSHVSRHGAYLCRPCDRLRRADRLRLAPVGADRDPDAGDRPRGALSRSEVRRRLPPLQGRGSPLALTIPPLPPAGPSDKPAPAFLPRPTSARPTKVRPPDELVLPCPRRAVRDWLAGWLEDAAGARHLLPRHRRRSHPPWRPPPAALACTAGEPGWHRLL